MTMPKVINLVWRRLRAFLKWPAATVEYPAVYRLPPFGSRVTIRNNFSECIGCHDCEIQCPVQCISILSEDFPNKEKTPITSRGVVFEKKVTSFKINYNQCVSCGICVDICSSEALSYEKNFIVPRQKNTLLIQDLVHRPRSVRIEQGFEE